MGQWIFEVVSSILAVATYTCMACITCFEPRYIQCNHEATSHFVLLSECELQLPRVRNAISLLSKKARVSLSLYCLDILTRAIINKSFENGLHSTGIPASTTRHWLWPVPRESSDKVSSFFRLHDCDRDPYISQHTDVTTTSAPSFLSIVPLNSRHSPRAKSEWHYPPHLSK